MRVKLQLLTMLIAVLLLGMAQMTFAQGVTTASVSGLITDNESGSLPGANVVVLHVPSGTKYGTTTRTDGRFTLPNVKVGGPYNITVSFVGFQNEEFKDVYLSLGQNYKLNAVLKEEAVALGAVEISSNRSSLINPDRTGAETNINAEQISKLPTISRDLTDFTRLTPQSALTEDGDGELGFSVAGQNNRFNSIFIDGAISNDVFGLTDQGTNGGQAGISPISVDAIEQFQVVVAPYDVTIGGFTGGGINAVTKSGSNQFSGDAYFYLRNQALAGKTPTDNEDFERIKLPDFSAKTYGVNLGGPIIKNKLFFFVNAELERRNQPLPAPFQAIGDSLVGYDGDSSPSEFAAFENRLKELGYDPGTYTDNEKTVAANKFLVKLDYSLNEKNKITLRHSYSKGEAEKINPSDRDNINYSNSYEFFPTTTNSTALEVNTIFNNAMSNNLILGYTRVRDDRDPLNGDFPRLAINDGGGFITAGSEPFSTANNLEQDIFTITNNLKLYKGKHTLTFGTHNEFYKVLNLFVRQNYGVYNYDNLADFMNGNGPSLYIRSYSLNDNVSGDAIENAAAKFNGMQLGFYVQDEFQLSDRIKLTGGLRIDVPIFSDSPPEDTYFNTTTAPAIEQFYDLKGARAGNMPSPQIMFSPRFGFNIDVTGDQTTQVRGGAGLFTSRLPLVWAGGSFTNNGLNVGGVFEFDPTLADGTPLPFEPDINQQYTATDFGAEDAVPSGQMDLFAENLKFPQVFRASLAVDQKLPWGLVGSVEGMFTKNINSIIYYNYNVKPSIGNLVGADNRAIFDRRDEIDDTYGRIMLGDNTSEGYTANFTASLAKTFGNGLSANLAYNYGYAEALNDLTSSQNSSQWRNMEVVDGKNNLSLSRSDFSTGSRIIGSISYTKNYLKHFGTSISLFYNGQSGEVFSYTYTGSRADALTSQDSRDFTDLIYVPNNMAESNLIDLTDGDGNVTTSAADQWADLDAYISQDDYLNSRRGDYAERNGSRTPFSHILDLQIAQDFFLKTKKGQKHNFKVTLDIYNFTNLLNKDWGRRYRSNFNGVGLINVESVSDEEGPNGQILRTPSYSFSRPSNDDPFSIDDVGTLSSRWQGRIGLRYSF